VYRIVAMANSTARTATAIATGQKLSLGVLSDSTRLRLAAGTRGPDHEAERDWVMKTFSFLHLDSHPT
jgi:hypothetical protein